MKAARAFWVPVTLIILLAACGTVRYKPAGSSGEHHSARAPVALQDTAPPDGGPAINWDNPIPDGAVVALSHARSAGALSFSPTAPGFGRAPVTVEVANPAMWHAVAFVYHFPTGPDFPVDGRVRVLEMETTVTQADLLAVASNPPGPASDFSVITISGHQALLVQGNGVGRVQFIRNGIEYDVTGPAVSPAEAEKLAALL